MEKGGEKYPGLVCLAFLQSSKPRCSAAPNAFPFTSSCSASWLCVGDPTAEEQQWCLDRCVEQPSSFEALVGGSLGQSGRHGPSDLRVLQGVLD